MRIGFDVSQTGTGRAGCGWYARSLIESLAAIDRTSEYLLYPTFGDFYWSPSGGADTYRPQHGNCRHGLRHRTLESMQSFWRNPPKDWEARLGDPDLVHANNYYCPVGLRSARLVYTLYDLCFLEEPDWSTEANRVGCFEGVFKASLYADFVVAISEHSRMDFLRHFPYFPADRIAAIYPASRFQRHQTQSPPVSLQNLRADGFWLHVGTDEPRKNLDHLLQAYALVYQDQTRRMPLVLAGGSGWLSGDLQRRLGDFGIARDVVALGYVDEETLRWLYESCFAFVFPSRAEGFGMPVLEAMQLGAPVIASRTTSIPEITGDCALLIDPRDSTSTADAMRKLVGDPQRRAELRRRGGERAARFSWETAARRVLEAYRAAIERPPRRQQLEDASSILA